MKSKLWIGGILAVLAIVVIGFFARLDSASDETQPQAARLEQAAEAASVVPVDAGDPMPLKEYSSDVAKFHADSGCTGCAQHAAHTDATEIERPALKMTEAIQQELVSLGKNSPISFALPGAVTASGIVELTRQENGQTVMVQGSLSAPQKGRFFFQMQSMPGGAGSMVGVVVFDKGDVAYSVEPGADGWPELKEKHADNVFCRNFAEVPPPEDEPQEIPADHPDDIAIPGYQNGVIPLSSLPDALGVVYLDFDGEEGPHAGWANIDAEPFDLSSAQIKDMWARVAEEFAPFNINVTTDLQVYLDAPENSRQRCIITKTSAIHPGAGGVAYVDSFNWTGDTPCWCFYYGSSGALVIAHEVGHTLGLSHDGRTTPSEGYYGGHSTAAGNWGPIMGAPYSASITHWSKGEYLNADQMQDDLAIIDAKNSVALRVDDHGDSFVTATVLEVHPDNSVDSKGVIETDADSDGFKFTITASSSVSLTVNTAAPGANLDVLAEIVDSNNTVVATANPDAALTATVGATLAVGDYFLRVTGEGLGDPLSDGFSSYGSLGFYNVTGTVLNAVQPDRFTVVENSTNTTAVGTVTPRNVHGADPITFAISSGNGSGAFALSASGELTVADSAEFDYEALSSYYDDPATFELFVDITNATTPALNEAVRVVVEVTDVNEAPTISAGGTFTLLEHTQTGTLITQLSASDVDHYDYATFSITAGNAGSIFAIDSSSGEITFAADTDATVQSNYNLTVTATDQGPPALTNFTVVTINLIDIQEGFAPGTVNQAYYLGISGSDISDLTSAAKYPASPDELYVRTELGSTDYGDNYGTRMRGYLIPPATGTYTFWMAMGDSGRLVLSTDDNSANAITFHEIAENKWANFKQWDKYPEQQSSNVVLQAGQPYYFEVLHKESTFGDWVSIGWQGPTLSRQIVSGNYIAPHTDNFSPVLNDESFIVASDSANGTVVGAITGADINPADTVGSYAILSGNTSGAFAIDSVSGQITVTNSAALTNGATFVLEIQGTDAGTPPLSDTATVIITAVEVLVDTHFETSDGFTGYVSPDHATLTTTVDNKGATWSTPDDAHIWNRSDIPPLGVQCLMLGEIGSTNTVDIVIPGTTNGVGTVRFDYASFSSGTSVDFGLWYRVSGGTWVQAWSTSVSGSSPDWVSKPWPFISVEVNQPGDVDLRLQVIGSKGVLVDSVLVTTPPPEPEVILIATTYGTVDGADDADQAGPVWGQSITINVGSTINDGAIPQTVGLRQVSFQTSGSGQPAVKPVAYLHVYDGFGTDGNGAVTNIGNLMAISTNTVDFGVVSTLEEVTWYFADDELDKTTGYFYILATNTTAATMGDSSNLAGAGFELNTGNPYAGGQAWQANGFATDWDMEFEVVTTTDIGGSLQPVGNLTMGTPSGGNITLGWITTAGQSYNVETNADLTTPNWGVFDTVIGDGGGVTITSGTDQVLLFFRVTSE